MMDFRGKVVVISGAARGQGRSHALSFAEAGAAVVAFDICRQIDSCLIPLATEADLAETARLVADAGGQVVTAVADVRSADQMQDVMNLAVERFGAIDVILANAGIAQVSSTLKTTPQEWQDVIDVNLTGVFNTVQPAIRHMLASGRGDAVVVTTSTAGLTPYPNQLAYVAAKFGLTGVIKGLALELAAHGIRVNGIAPSTVATPLALNEVFFELFAGDPSASQDQVAPMFQKLNAIQRPWLEVDEISRVAMMLASDDFSGITGQVIPVDLGFLTRGPFDPIDSRMAP